MSDELEALVGKHGLGFVLDMLATICGEKADHIRANWQDATTAKAWDYAAKRIGKVSADKQLP